MSYLQNLIDQIEDSKLKERIRKETDKLLKRKKFGLVFEEHLPECIPLYDVPIHVGSKITKKSGYINDLYFVESINGEEAVCVNQKTRDYETFQLSEIVSAAEFGEPIYPALQMIDSVENAPDSEVWNTLIEADNYHALQLLEYLYTDKVDCIYIDPPYNSGAKDWKYNNNYVDDNDQYRHSKWLSMMEKRLRIAKRLLKKKTGALIVTIDEKEYRRLGLLLEEIFPDATIQMVTIVNNPKGSTRDRFSRVEEYAYFCFMPETCAPRLKDSMLGTVNEQSGKTEPRWKGLLKSGTQGSSRAESPDLFYPVLVDEENGLIVRANPPIPKTQEPDMTASIDGYTAAWPIRNDGSMGRWMLSTDKFNDYLQQGYIKLGSYDKTRNTWAFSYLSKQHIDALKSGTLEVVGRSPNGQTLVVGYPSAPSKRVKTVWHRTRHDAGVHGSALLSKMLPNVSFDFPKSLYAVRDAIQSIVSDVPNALVLDFFAGSGTTLHAVNLLNAEDGGHRRCILVTNNEVSENEAQALKNKGLQPGNKEWEELGVARYITWPRTKCSILGCDVDGRSLEGEYLTSLRVSKDVDRKIKQIRIDPNILDTNARKDLISFLGKDQLPQSLVKEYQDFIISDKYPVSFLFNPAQASLYLNTLEGCDNITDFYIVTTNAREFRDISSKIEDLLGPYTVNENEKIPMANGFKTNAAFFKLCFLDKTSVELGRQFRELLPVLWMKAGCRGKCPLLDSDEVPSMLVLPENNMAVLIDEPYYSEFEKNLHKYSEIQTVYIVTDSESAYQSMIAPFKDRTCCQLYRDYLDNFRINTRR